MDRPIASIGPLEPPAARPATIMTARFGWSAIFAGALAASGLGAILLTFGLGIGLSYASPAATWQDTSAGLAFASGLWLLLTALASFALGGLHRGPYTLTLGASRHRRSRVRDGVHGLIAWALAVVFAAVVALATAAMVSPHPGNLAAPSTSTAESLFAFELDHLFRSDRAPVATEGDLRAQAARIISSGVGHSGISPEDRSYLVRLTAARTGLPPNDAEGRVTQVLREAETAVTRARHGGVILSFMTAVSLLLAAATAWYAALLGGEHRDRNVVPSFWVRQPAFGYRPVRAR